MSLSACVVLCCRVRPRPCRRPHVPAPLPVRPIIGQARQVCSLSLFLEPVPCSRFLLPGSLPPVSCQPVLCRPFARKSVPGNPCPEIPAQKSLHKDSCTRPLPETSASRSYAGFASGETDLPIMARQPRKQLSYMQSNTKLPKIGGPFRLPRQEARGVRVAERGMRASCPGASGRMQAAGCKRPVSQGLSVSLHPIFAPDLCARSLRRTVTRTLRRVLICAQGRVFAQGRVPVPGSRSALASCPRVLLPSCPEFVHSLSSDRIFRCTS